MHHLLLKKWDVNLCVTHCSSGLYPTGGSGTVLVRTEMKTEQRATPARLSETVSYRLWVLWSECCGPSRRDFLLLEFHTTMHVRPGGGSER